MRCPDCNGRFHGGYGTNCPHCRDNGGSDCGNSECGGNIDSICKALNGRTGCPAWYPVKRSVRVIQVLDYILYYSVKVTTKATNEEEAKRLSELVLFKQEAISDKDITYELEGTDYPEGAPETGRNGNGTYNNIGQDGRGQVIGDCVDCGAKAVLVFEHTCRQQQEEA